MFSKRIVLLTAALAVALLAITSAVASAQGPDRRRGWGPRGFTYGVDLTPEQREQIRAILEEERQQRRANDPTADFNRQLELELLADIPDQARLDSLRTQIVEAQQARLQKMLEIRQRIAQVLTPEQRAQARENVAKGGKRR
jgi:Spy/CpxP family protein refolding chaperone